MLVIEAKVRLEVIIVGEEDVFGALRIGNPHGSMHEDHLADAPLQAKAVLAVAEARRPPIVDSLAEFEKFGICNAHRSIVVLNQQIGRRTAATTLSILLIV